MSGLIAAARRGDREAAARRLGQRGRADLSGNTALMAACERGHAEVASMIVEAPLRAQNCCASCFVAPAESEVGRANSQGMTALMLAAGKGHYACVKLLTQLEARSRDLYGQTALMYAARSVHADTVAVIRELLPLEGGMTSLKGLTALMYAARVGQAAAVMALLETGSEAGIFNNSLATRSAMNHKVDRMSLELNVDSATIFRDLSRLSLQRTRSVQLARACEGGAGREAGAGDEPGAEVIARPDMPDLPGGTGVMATMEAMLAGRGAAGPPGPPEAAGAGAGPGVSPDSFDAAGDTGGAATAPDPAENAAAIGIATPGTPGASAGAAGGASPFAPQGPRAPQPVREHHDAHPLLPAAESSSGSIEEARRAPAADVSAGDVIGAAPAGDPREVSPEGPPEASPAGPPGGLPGGPPEASESQPGPFAFSSTFYSGPLSTGSLPPSPATLDAAPNGLTGAAPRPLYTALSFAACEGHLECLRVLLPHEGGLQDPAAGNTALMNVIQEILRREAEGGEKPELLASMYSCAEALARCPAERGKHNNLGESALGISLQSSTDRMTQISLILAPEEGILDDGKPDPAILSLCDHCGNSRMRALLETLASDAE